MYRKLTESFNDIKNKFTSIADIISNKEKMFVRKARNSLLPESKEPRKPSFNTEEQILFKTA